MLRYLPQVQGRNVVFFQTHGTSPTSEHAITSFARAGYHLGPDCEILGTFGCRGKINPAMLEKRKNAGPDDPHGGAKSMERWKLASTHPDAEDEQHAREFVQQMKRKLVQRERFAQNGRRSWLPCVKRRKKRNKGRILLDEMQTKRSCGT